MHDTTREILPEIHSEKNVHDGCTEEPHPSGKQYMGTEAPFGVGTGYQASLGEYMQVSVKDILQVDNCDRRVTDKINGVGSIMDYVNGIGNITIHTLHHCFAGCTIPTGVVR